MKAFNLLNLVKLGGVIFAALLPLTASANVSIGLTFFPDPNFREFVKQYDKNNDGTLSDSELAAVTSMNVSNKKIRSLFGIHFFPNLVTLDCSKNSISSLDVSKNTKIRTIYCYKNKFGQTAMLKFLNSLPMAMNPTYYTPDPAYIYFRCSDESVEKGGNTEAWNQAIPQAKYWFYCYECDQSGTATSQLVNKLPAVDVNETNFPDPIFRSFIQNKYGTSIPFDNIETITKIDVSGKGIKSLKGIEWFNALKELNCSNNYLTSLDLSYSPYARVLNIGGNRIFGTEMDKFAKTLAGYDCAPEDNVVFTWLDMIDPHEGNAYTKDNYWDIIYSGRVPCDGSTNPIESSPVYLNERSFPDAWFRSFIQSQPYGSDSKITAEELADITTMYIAAGNYQDLTGLDYFSELRTLHITNVPNLTSVNLARNTKLQELKCTGNKKLTKLDLSKNFNLRLCDCRDNSLTSLIIPTSYNLKYLYIMRNQLGEAAMMSIAAQVLYNWQYGTNYFSVYNYMDVIPYDNETGKEGNEFNLNHWALMTNGTGATVYHQNNLYYTPSGSSPTHNQDAFFKYDVSNQLFFGDNYVTRITGNSGTWKTVPLSLNIESTRNIVGLTFDLTLPEGVTLVGASLDESRLSGHTVSCAHDANYPQTYHVTVSNGAPIVGTSGTAVNVTLNMLKSLEGVVRLHNVVLKANVGISHTYGSATTEDLLAGPFTTRIVVTNANPMKGDVNNSRSITPADAIMVLYHYFNVEQTGFNLDNADMNNDKSITPADAIEVLYKYFDASGARATKPATTTATEDMDPE